MTDQAESSNTGTSWFRRAFGLVAAGAGGITATLFTVAKDIGPSAIETLKELGPQVGVIGMLLWMFAHFLKMWGDSNERRFREIIDEGKEDRKAFGDAIKGLQGEMKGIQEEIGALRESLITGSIPRLRRTTAPPVSTR